MVRHLDPDDLALLAVTTQRDSAQRDSAQRDSTQRDSTQHDSIQRDSTQRDSTQHSFDQHDPAIDAHLAGCADCSATFETFRATADLARLSNYGELAPRPAAQVWDAIAAELQLPIVAEPARDPLPDRSDPVPSSAGPGFPDPGAQAEPEGPTESSRGLDIGVATPIRVRRNHRPRWLLPLAALVVGAALGAGGLAISQSGSGNNDVEAVAELTPVPGGPIADPGTRLGEAQLIAVGQSQRIRVDAGGLPSIVGAYEVWLFGDDGRMVSLGSLNAGVGDFTVPQGIDTSEYRTVDISDEAADGNPAHSGISVVRGSF